MTMPSIAASATGSPAWHTQETSNWVASSGRLRDQLANPNYWLLRESQADTSNADPYRAPKRWAPDRGRVWPISYLNRYGARISGHLWAPPKDYRDPVTGRRQTGPYPAVVFVNGSGSVEEEYRSFAEDFAEAGYVVLTFDPQGAGHSASAPNPTSKYCSPHGAWRRPQQLGVREHGKCAGENDNGVNSTAGQVPGVATLAVDGRTGRQGTLHVQKLYRQLEPNFVFGAFDAYHWLASRADTHRRLVDFSRVGIVGHSLGAYAAALVGNGDPHHRFRAAVALDSYAHFMHGVRARIPTMYEQSEQELLSGPRLSPPPPTALHATRRDYPHFVRRHVPVFYDVLRSSTHQEFDYLGPESPHQTASRYGQRVATYFALAWLDRYVKGAGIGHSRRVVRRNATGRLLAHRFDASVDRSSIGLGRWDPVTRTNQPYKIAGRRVRDALSRLYVSRYHFGRHASSNVVRNR